MFSVTDIGEGAIVAEPPVDLERGTVLAGRYQVEAFVGKGGSGVVLRAFDRITQTPVALKILNSELAADPRWIERFARELRLGRQIQHPNVCRVFDIGEADGHRFLSMELATGGTLRDAVRPGATERPLASRVADARALVSGLAALHAAGIIHRDVKPENLLRMEDGRVVLSDFGLATNPLQAPAVTVMVGTPSYMAPEIVMGDPASFRSDVWALGVTVHEILFCRRPEWEIVDGVRALRVPAGAGATALEQALSRLCALCAGERTDTRPANAGEVLQQFVAIEAGRPAPVISAPRRPLGDWRRRRATWAMLGAVSLMALLFSRRMWSSATAATALPELSRRTVGMTGDAQDWSTTSNRLAKIDGKVHCLALTHGDRKARVVWGAPRVAEEIDLETGDRQKADLLPDAFQYGCPETSPVAAELLFEQPDGNGRRQIMLSPSGDGSNARPLTPGSEPVWLRNGKEFAYAVDDGHAAVFSLPVMSSAIVGDGDTAPRTLIGKFVSGDGALLGLRYMDASFNKTIVVHRLPSLEVVDRVGLTKAFKEASFAQSADDLLLSFEEGGDVILAGLGAGRSDAVRMGFIPGMQLREAVVAQGRVVFLARKLVSDVWTLDAGRASRQLTSDGASYHPDVAGSGDLLVESLRPGGDLVIRLFPAAGGKPVMLTQGPLDLTPSFLPGGRGWLYVQADRRAIMRCTGTGADCRSVYTSDVLPLFPVGSPDGKAIAYLSAVSRSRLFVWTPGASAPRDLGPARMDCAPRWSAADRLWVLQGADNRAKWVELSSTTGNATGHVVAAGEARAVDYGCPYSTLPPAAERTADVVAVALEPSELRVH